MKKLSSQEIENISNSVSMLDYFDYLESKGIVTKGRKQGRDEIFRTQNAKYGVRQNGFYDYHTETGGGIFKAVMTLENKSWEEALNFLKDFSNTYVPERKNTKTIAEKEKEYSAAKVLNSYTPNNKTLLNYFKERGISETILKEVTQQVHYEAGGRKYFGIGLKNESGGYEIRNPMMKTKIGKNDISVIEGTNKKEMFVFEGMTDTLSFIQLLNDNNRKNDRTLITLNSVSNSSKFIERFKDFDGKIYLLLDGDKPGEETTLKITEALSNAQIKDVRNLYNINENGYNDLNQYLTNKYQSINKENQYEKSSSKSNGISNSQQVGGNTLNQNSSGISQSSESEQKENVSSRHRVGGNHVGNGLDGAERSNHRGSDQLDTSTPPKQLEDEQKITDGELRDRLHGSGRGENPGSEVAGDLSSTEEISIGESRSEPSNLAELITLYSGKKVSNDEISEIVNRIAYVDEDQTIQLKPEIEITDDIKDIISQYKTGGVAKEGRGILDEYYTNYQIVDVVQNLIKDHLNGKSEITALEPSIGTGNFVPGITGMGIKTNITGFEINDVTAKIAKILHPDITVNLRSFETEFITDNGFKKDFDAKYDLVIGNPPYGSHRGEYKGLGEESGISRYEDYFMKRGVDSLKEGGVLAMVIPSSWIERQKNLEGSELLHAFRLPSGVFQSTQIGTDIIIIKKNSNAEKQDISKYFEKNVDYILGETRQRTNRFGKEENYTHGNLDEALQLFEQIQSRKNSIRTGSLFQDLSDTEVQKIESNESKVINEVAEKEKQEDNPLILTAREKVDAALEQLQKTKFKSVLIQKTIQKYEGWKKALANNKLDEKTVLEITDKANTIIDKYKTGQSSEYLVQTKPEIKKGVLKYQFSKNDEILETALHNSSKLSAKQINAFQDTSYDGTLNNRGKHAEFANYYAGRWVHDFYYAEGNIYEKLEQLERDFQDKHSVGGLENQYEKQKALLENVLPKKKELDDIIISPNHEFIHKFSMGVVEKQRWNPDKRQTEAVMEQASLADVFIDFVRTLPSDAFMGSSSWEVSGFVNNESVTGSDKERNALIRERRKEAANDLFKKYLQEELSPEDKKRFVNEFNQNYNNIHIPDYSNFPLFSKIYKNFKGKELRLTEVQKAGIGRLTTKGVGLLAHEVGFGKTLSGILSMHEAMERGNATRPLIVVPNDNILKQWVETIFETIPDAKINVLGNLGKSYDLSKFDNKDGEITLVTYEGFNSIGFKRAITENLASKFSYISQNEMKGIQNVSARDVEIEIQKEKEIEGKMRRGKVYDWEDFGFDHLTFDEVHNANHIVGKVKIEDRRFASDFRNQNQITSKIGINTWMAAQYIQEQNDGRNVTLLSATPFTNKPLEYYSILSLIANKRLEESGYFNVNTFFETFMEADNDMEIDAKGDVKFKTNVRRFKNNALFQQLLSEFIDIKGEEDNPDLKRPNRINKEYKIEQNDLTKEEYEKLNENFVESEKGGILTHILNARLIALSPYLSKYYTGEQPNYKDFVENSPKLQHTMSLIKQNKSDKPEAGQIIYSELAVGEFPKLKDYLVNEVGYQEHEVGIITGATTKPQRIAIQEDFNKGNIKIIIGSEAIQEGMNLQENTTDMYLLSLPYNFTSLRQTEGRAWRQGNQWENVRINFMLTNDSIDVFMLQKLQAKQARYLEAMKKGANVVDVSDVNTQELKTAIITNPETRANIEIELMKKRIESEKSKFLADSTFVLRKYQDFLKIQEEVTRAQYTYNRILGYSKEEGENSEYWKNQLPFYQNSIDAAKDLVSKEIESLSKKGVNVTEIEQQTKITEEKIAELDKKREGLSQLKEELISKYTAEKMAKMERESNHDIVKERMKENQTFFKIIETKTSKNEPLEVKEVVENKTTYKIKR